MLDITKLKCNSGLKATNPGGARAMCGDDFYAWLDTQVPPADGAPGWSEPPDNSWEMKLRDDPPGFNPGGDDLPYDRHDIRKGDRPSKKNFKPSEGDLDPLEIHPELDIGVPDALSGPFEDPGGNTFMNRDPGRPGKPGPPDDPGRPDSPGKPSWVEFQPGRR